MKQFKRKHLQTAGRVTLAAVMFVITLYIGNLSSFNFFENKIHDSFFQLRCNIFPENKKDSPLVIVGIDKSTLAANPEPVIFWDDEFSSAIEAVLHAKPGVIGFDILHLSSIDSKKYDFGRLKLGGILMLKPEIVLPYVIDNGDLSIPVFLAKQYRETFGFSDEMNIDLKLKLLAIAERARGISFGYANLSDDKDGIVRRMDLYDYSNKSPLESFSLKIFLKYSQFKGENIVRSKHNLIVNGFIIPEMLTVNYRGAPGTISMIPMEEVIRNSKNESYLKKNFAGKAVIFGSYDPALGDIHNTPFISSGLGITRGMYGAEIVANSVDTLIGRRLISKISFTGELFFCMFFSFFGMVFSRQRTWMGIFFFLSAGALYISAAFFLFTVFSFLTGMLPLLALFFTFFTGYLYSHHLIGRDRHLLESVLRSYLDPRVVDRVVEQRGSDILKGERRLITVMFADIRNFTTLSETKKRPEDVVDILNLYLPAMSAIIQKSEGCVDKFIGDGIMAFWNAPNDVTDHAEKAVLCAIEMQNAMISVNAAAKAKGLLKSDLSIGIGVHTGNAVVGNIGSSIRHDYTAIGDTVNSASRLEGKTKDLGYPIIISDSTKVLISENSIKTIPAGMVEVKGKKQKIRVFGIDAV